MTTSQSVHDRIVRCGLLAGMRGYFPPAVAVPLAETLLEAGIDVMEFTMNSQQPIEAMTAVKRAFGDTICVTMGTVLDVETAQRVIDAGAEAVISPAFNRAVVETSLKAGVMMVPGAMTPSEVLDAWSTGVSMVKLFPVGPLGLDYLKALRGPIDHVPLMCNGGTNDKNVGDFIRAGAVACGMAAWLVGDGTHELSAVGERARRLRQIVDDARQPVPAA